MPEHVGALRRGAGGVLEAGAARIPMAPAELPLVPTEAHPGALYAASQPWCECRVTLDPGFLLTRVLDIVPGAPSWVRFPQIQYFCGTTYGNHWDDALQRRRLASLTFEHAGVAFLVLFRTDYPGADYVAIGHVLREYPVVGYWHCASEDISCEPADTVVITCELPLASWEGGRPLGPIESGRRAGPDGV